MSIRVIVIAGLFALTAAYLIGGRYASISNQNAVGVYDRFTGRVYPGGTSYAPPAQAERD